MLNILIKEYEQTNDELSGEIDINKINYLNGVLQGITISMSNLDFVGTRKYFDNSDDLPY